MSKLHRLSILSAEIKGRNGCHLKTAEMVMLSVNAVGITVVCDIITAVIRF